MSNASSFQPLSSLLKAASDPLRLEILCALSSDSFGVLELCHIFDIKQSSMSHHLKIMSTAGLVTTRKEGNSVFYRRSPVLDFSEFKALRTALEATLKTLELSAATQNRIQDIYINRAQAAKAFFHQHSEKFRETQELIASFEVYGPQVAEILNNSRLPAKQLVLEIGPGEGEFLATLAAEFAQVVALDITPAMLEKARAHNQGLSNIEYVCDDTRWCRKQKQRFNAAVMNMVLHHTPSPQSLFADASKALQQGGVLVICDLCRHQQDWVKEACGDLWQGFDPQELRSWAEANHLREGQSAFIALRNGFQIQVQQFLKH